MIDDALLSITDVYAGDPLNPDMVAPTPVEVVATLNRPQREKRVRKLIQQAEAIFCDGITKHLDGHRLAATCVLFSGGNDSTVLAHMFQDRATHAIHCNTTIGIEETRQFVRDTCAAWSLPLLEEIAPRSYRDLVMDEGFPGPGMHWKMYQRLKERGLDQAREKLISNPRRERVVFIAGRRRAESKRRKRIVTDERDGSAIWVSPLANWTALDMNTYRLMMGDVPVNRVSEILHMSGECLCGAFAKPNELAEIRDWFPDVAAEIDSIAAEAEAVGYVPPLNTWGHGEGVASKTGRMCDACDLTLFEAGA